MASEILSDVFLKFFAKAKNPPKRLYYKGNIELLHKRKIALIGSRKMSVYTRNCVLELGFLLRQAGVCIVSGGALGVDITALQASMPSSIAIFANGLGNIYPKSNEKIIRQIYQNGLALSENIDDYIPKKYDFLLRNRLVVALSEAVIIAQADLQSGSMQSARLCEKLKKPLFVLPQRMNESKGTNILIEEHKAELLSDFEIFAQKMGFLVNQKNDEFLEFCRKGVSVEEALKLYGDKLYEYELEGKIEIDGVRIRVLV
ncbi:DNA-processing protein DprA [Campylobacter sp. MIT 21-1685]|uniref:DNA-processing protein DprA n=1 Tax=unclassified Campylobacter TaxID=2593542 RepID=UPI00224AD27A|nr:MULTISPECIES: DNA-processing protein DprA [unclassified Campylobacter]MCX2682290.1 DNA-processing protein DprA [Campylobacter sp. MIT 21-1684]MCX2750570.1 DNA-processing protein DprA [Campylobacter sp. MIT 21-1682]MCX2806882.1 DNA-processing protein DprA [Campylobacter sp. MIT 21-1685]